MILDDLVSSPRYEALGPRFARALQWLRSVDPETLPEGKTVLDGDDLYALVFRNATKAMARVKWEAHRKYADIQYVAAGSEALLWEPLGRAQPGTYDPEKDFLALEVDSWADFELTAGQFVILFPEDAHRPGIEIPGADPVVKIVVKVRL